MKKYFLIVLFIYAMILFSCASRRSSVFIPVPDEEYFKYEKKTFDTANITETKDGISIDNLPVWLSAYFNGGIEEVERISFYSNKYVFIGINEGVNFFAMNMWANNYSPAYDFTILAAERIERRMISSASLYPDNEYGPFFEAMVKKAYSTLYQGAVKEDTYWVKIRVNNEDVNEEFDAMGFTTDVYSEVFNFFVLVTIDKRTMQNVINDMMEEVNSSVAAATSSQRNAVNRLQQTFFEGF